MMLINPTKENISVQIDGVKYTIEAKGYLVNISKEHAKYWQENLHNFLIIDESDEKKDTKKSKDTVIEDKPEDQMIDDVIVDNIEEEVIEEVIEDAPKKDTKKSK